MQRPAVVSCGDLLVSLFRLRHGQLARGRDHAKQRGIEAFDALQIDVGKPFRGELAFLDPARKPGYWGEGDVLIVGGQRTRDRACCAETDCAAGPAACPGRAASQCDQGANVGSSATLRGPTRRS